MIRMHRVCLSYVFIAVFVVPFTLSADKSRIYDTVTGIDAYGEVEYLDVPRPKLFLLKKEIYHYEILEVFLTGVQEADENLFAIRIVRDGRVYPSVGMEERIPFKRRDEILRAVYLPDWNQREGEYEIEVFYGNRRLKIDSSFTFTLLRRPVPDIEPGISIVDLETNESIAEKILVDPAGRKTDYSAILEWAAFMDADMLWILAGETTTFHVKRKGASPWDRGPLENLELLKERAPYYGIEIGAYIMSFYVPGPEGIPGRYEPGLGYNAEKGTLYRSKHISLSSEQRIQDMIELARRFQQDPQIGYIGFDFIRTGRADGYELAQQVIDETNISTSQEWAALDAAERIKWFARKIEVERDPLVVEKWRWWRAHRVAQIVKRIMDEAEITKPVWVYTLGWNHGKEHGQDPVMFFDAGVTFDAVMLYEASQSQFERLLGHWNRYISTDQGNIVVGSCVDYKLLDSDSLSPPDEFFRRNTEAYQNVMRDGFAKGIFFHDIARAFWGRKGGYTFIDYAMAHMSSVYGLRRELRTLDLVVDVLYEEEEEGRLSGALQCKNNSTRDLENICIELVYPSFPVAVTFYRDSHDENRDGMYYPGTDVMYVGNLQTFQTISVPFTVYNLANTYTTIIFRVAVENNRHYYVREVISPRPGQFGEFQASLD
jgi:hypothetical protein